MAQAAALRSGKRTADAGAGVHRAIRRRGALNSNSNGAASTSGTHTLLAPVGTAGPSSRSGHHGLATSTSTAAVAAPQQLQQPQQQLSQLQPVQAAPWPASMPQQHFASSTAPPFMPPGGALLPNPPVLVGAGVASMEPAAATAAAFLAPGCTLGTPATSAPGGVASVNGFVSGMLAPTTGAVSDAPPALGVPTFPSMALAAAKAGCFGPYGMMMGSMPSCPPPMFMLMMQRQMAMMQQAMMMQQHAAGAARHNMVGMPPTMATMTHPMAAAPGSTMQQQQQQQQAMLSGMYGGANPALMQASGGGMPCYPHLSGPTSLGAGGPTHTTAPWQPTVAAPVAAEGAAAVSKPFLPPHQQLLPSLDMAAVVSALAAQEQQQQQQQGCADDSTTTTTATTTRSSAGGAAAPRHNHGQLGALQGHQHQQHHQQHHQPEGPSSSTDTLTGGGPHLLGGDASTAGLLQHQHHHLEADAMAGVGADEAQLTDLEFNSFIDSFLLTSTLAGSSGALDALALGGGVVGGSGAGSGGSAGGGGGGGGGVGGGSVDGLMLEDVVHTVGDAALDLHLPLAELLPELALDPPTSAAVAPVAPPASSPLPPQQQQPQPASSRGVLPLGLSLEPQSVLEGLGSLVPAAAVGERSQAAVMALA